MASILLDEDFSDPEGSALALSLLKHPLVDFAPGEGPGGRNAIRVSYVGFEMGSQRIVVDHPIGGRLKQASLCYAVFFEEDFQWTEGGKLPGLGPLRHLAGGRERRKDGWSARNMFLGEGHCRNYLYDQSDARWGEGEITRAPVFKKNCWHQVELQIGLNTTGKGDGFARTYLDGSLLLENRGIEYQGNGTAESEIQMLLFHTFHGGQTPEWAPVDAEGAFTVVHARFADFKVLSLE